MADRGEIRTQILSGNQDKFESKILPLFGAKVEIRQPTLAAILAYQKAIGEDEIAFVRLMIDFCFVPGSKEKVFEEADKESLLQMPFTKELQDFILEITALMGVQVEVAEGNLESNPA